MGSIPGTVHGFDSWHCPWVRFQALSMGSIPGTVHGFDSWHSPWVRFLALSMGSRIINNDLVLQETPLHVAASSPLASPQAVAMIVNVAVNAHNWAVVDARDNAGNTALHHAAHAGNNIG
jgi:hypothetical protein